MAASFLVIGATGNTGRGVVQLLSERLESSQKFSNYRILAQTRSANSARAKELSKYAHVDIIEYSWTDITTEWLREHKVIRAFVASQPQPSQFAEESAFHLAALQAGVDLARTPDAEAYYPRAHWAIEAMLDSPAFDTLHWTSLQPNIFADHWLASAAELIKKVKAGEKQYPLSMHSSADGPIAIIHPHDVSTVAAELLLQNDTFRYNKLRLELNGPEDITGRQLVELVETHIRTKVEDVRYKDVSFLDDLLLGVAQTKSLAASIKRAVERTPDGIATTRTTSPEVFELAPPKKTPADVLNSLLR